MQGGGGFRSGVVRCDQPCLLAQVPANYAVLPEPASGDELGLTTIGLCTVCDRLVATSLGDSWHSADYQSRSIDAQLSKFDQAGFAVTPERVALTASRRVDLQHGTNAAYVAGCVCGECRSHQRVRMAKQRK